MQRMRKEVIRITHGGAEFVFEVADDGHVSLNSTCGSKICISKTFEIDLHNGGDVWISDSLGLMASSFRGFVKTFARAYVELVGWRELFDSRFGVVCGFDGAWSGVCRRLSFGVVWGGSRWVPKVLRDSGVIMISGEGLLLKLSVRPREVIKRYVLVGESNVVGRVEGEWVIEPVLRVGRKVFASDPKLVNVALAGSLDGFAQSFISRIEDVVVELLRIAGWLK